MSKVECVNCQRLNKQLNVQKADYEFEIKKIQEDKSTEKAMYEIHLQKQLRRWQENFHKEQSHREDQARNWLIKYDNTVSTYQTNIQKLKQDHSNILSKKIYELTDSANKKYAQTVTKYENQITFLEKSHKQMIEKMSQSYSEEIRCIRNKNQETIQKLKNSHKNILDQKVNRYEGKVLGLESENKKECQLHRKTKQEAQDSQTKLYQQIFGYKKNAIELENKIQTLGKQIQQKKVTIKGLEEEIVTIKQNNEQNICNLKIKHSQQLKEAQEKYKNKIKAVYEDALKYCNQYQQSITKIDQTRMSQKQQYMSNLEQIQQSMENRISRPEDLVQIEQLRLCLAKKIKECDLMNQQLKWYRLELENKEQTYNKIFVPISGSNNENIIGKRKQFKLRRQGRSVTTVREILQSINSGNLQKKNTPLIPKPKVL